ncbi:MAG: hypothetical protein U0235_11130 [Polyangiaceae bacterium]
MTAPPVATASATSSVVGPSRSDAAKASLPSPIAYDRYVNPRFGFGVDVPTFLHAEEPPTNGDGRTFTFGDALELRAWGMYGVEPLDEAWKRDATQRGVTYKSIQGDGYVVSGTAPTDGGSRVFYKRTVVAGDVVMAVELEYAASLKAEMDPVVARVAGSLARASGVSP